MGFQDCPACKCIKLQRIHPRFVSNAEDQTNVMRSTTIGDPFPRLILRLTFSLCRIIGLLRMVSVDRFVDDQSAFGLNYRENVSSPAEI